MRSKKKKVLPATPEERKTVKKLTERSVVERLKAGEAEIVEDFDWSNAPKLVDGKRSDGVRVPLSKTLYRKLKAASRKAHMTPDRLATKILLERLAAEETR